MQETLKVRQANLDSLHAAHRTLVRDSEALDATVPQHVHDKLQQIDAHWLSIQELMRVVRTQQQQQQAAAAVTTGEVMVAPKQGNTAISTRII